MPASPSRSTFDLLLTLYGVFLLAFAPVAFVTDFALGTVPPWFDFVLTGAVALPLALEHWHAGRPVGDLGMTFFWAVVLGIPVGAIAVTSLGVATTGVETGSLAEFLVRMGFVAVVYAVAYRLARWGGLRSLRRREQSSSGGS